MSFDFKVTAVADPQQIGPAGPAGPAVIRKTDKASLLAAVVDQRVQSFANKAFAEFAKFGSHATEIIEQHVEKLKSTCVEYFEKWELSELEQYQQWQTSAVVTKINQAAEKGLIKKPNQLHIILSGEELLQVNEFNKSRLGQMKLGIDAVLKPIVEECFQDLQNKILDPLCF